MFHLFAFPSWKSSEPNIIGIKTYLFENSARKKAPVNFRWLFKGKNPLKMGNYTRQFFRCLKIIGEAGKQEILLQMFRKF